MSTVIRFNALPDNIKKQIDEIMSTIKLKEGEGIPIAGFPDINLKGGLVLYRKDNKLYVERSLRTRNVTIRYPVRQLENLRQTNIWVRCGPLHDTSLSLKNILDNPILLLTAASTYSNLEQLNDFEHHQLETILKGNVDHEFEDQYGTMCVLHTLPFSSGNDHVKKESFSLDDEDNDDSSSLKWPNYMRNIVPYMQTCINDTARVRLLLRGSVDDLNAFQLLHRFIPCVPKLHNNINALSSLSHIDEFKSFVKNNTDIFLKGTRFVSKGDLVSMALYLWGLVDKNHRQLLLINVPTTYYIS
jgi:hypothetical protein